MQTISLPASPAAFADAGWADIAPYFDELATAPLTNESVEDWLKSWSQLEELVDEAGTLAMIAYTGDTADSEKEKAHLRFSTEVFPQAHEQSVRLSKRLLELGYTRPGLETTVARFRTDAEIFREANVPLFAELEELSAAYQKIVGGARGAQRCVSEDRWRADRGVGGRDQDNPTTAAVPQGTRPPGPGACVAPG